MAKDIDHILKKAGLKITPARKLILAVFSSGCNPINAESIHNKLKKHDINQVTIYRTLTSLEQAKIIQRVDLRKGSSYYEFETNHHHHIVCMKCGDTERFDDCNVNKITKNVLGKSSIFQSVNQHSLELFGMCKSCTNR